MLKRRKIGNGPLGGAAGGGLSAPVLGYPSPLASNPFSVAVSIPVDWQSADALKLAYSTSSAMTSPTVLSHTITDADVTAGTATIGLPTFAGINYLQAYGNHGGADSSNKSNIVTWGDTTAPTITTSATQSPYEQVALAVTLSATDTGGVPALVSNGTSPGWYIAGGVDQLEFQVAIVGGVPTLQWINNGTQTYDTGSNHASQAQSLGNDYHVTIGCIDYGGNASTLALTATVQAISASLSPAFTNVNNASLSTLYTSNTTTVTVTPAGVSIAASVTGAGFTYSKNGGAYQAAGSFTVQNGDTITLQVTSGASNSITETATLSVGGGLASQAWSVATPGSSAVLTSTAGTSMSKLMTVSGTPKLHWNVDSGGAVIISRATIPAANADFYMELTIGAWGTGGRNVIGVTDTSIDFNGGGSGFFGGGSAYPGDSGQTGFSLEIASGATQITLHYNATTLAINIGGTAAAGDVIGLRYNSSTNKVDAYYKVGAGAMSHIGSQQTLTSLIPSTCYAFSGGLGTGDNGTVNFGATTFALGGTGSQGAPSGSNYYA